MRKNDMKAEELLKKYGMGKHPENGYYLETHYKHIGEGRPASGSIYYYLEPNVISEFHKIDCDEYWIYNAGSPLEIWLYDENGKLEIKKLGLSDGDPNIYIKKGTTFAARHSEKTSEGTFITCITVPRFSPAGFTLYTRSEITEKYPESEKFYKR